MRRKLLMATLFLAASQVLAVDAYGDLDYGVEARALGERSGQSEKVRVPRAAKPAPLSLRLRPE